MKQKKKKHPFKKCQTGFHEFAVIRLAEWIGGKTEIPFFIDGVIAFVPDVVYGNDLFEVVYSNPIHGRKLGIIQAWSYFNNTNLNLFEVSADWILKQTEKPKEIEYTEIFEITLKT